MTACELSSEATMHSRLSYRKPQTRRNAGVWSAVGTQAAPGRRGRGWGRDGCGRGCTTLPFLVCAAVTEAQPVCGHSHRRAWSAHPYKANFQNQKRAQRAIPTSEKTEHSEKVAASATRGRERSQSPGPRRGLAHHPAFQVTARQTSVTDGDLSACAPSSAPHIPPVGLCRHRKA